MSALLLGLEPADVAAGGCCDMSLMVLMLSAKVKIAKTSATQICITVEFCKDSNWLKDGFSKCANPS